MIEAEGVLAAFVPQADITAYELALLMKHEILRHRIFERSDWMNLPQGIRRHFVVEFDRGPVLGEIKKSLDQ